MFDRNYQQEMVVRKNFLNRCNYAILAYKLKYLENIFIRIIK